ncbi:hypothetical protein RND81_08G091700 [Saponaria officinalis]|uniref:No apical meristem-associated C-terminal domain-containing protein n=1 Tax=Saponaria officinalis TaxID=3572 RepID=A0AAW1J708_SAPOF
MDSEDPYSQYYSLLENSPNNEIIPPPRPLPRNANIQPPNYSYQPIPQPYYPGYYYQPYMAPENTRKNSLDSFSNQDTSAPTSGTESQTRQDEVQIVETSNMKCKFKWSQIKDEDLCKSWLTISNDGATGNHQSYNSYWQRIVDYYNEWRKDGEPIDIPKASNHWFKMSAEVSKFNGCYIQIKESHPSGHNEDSLKNMANQLWSTRYKKGQQKTFPYLHSWEILRHQPKWEEFANKNKNSVSSKRLKNSMSGTYSSSTNTRSNEANNGEEISENRPIGQKAAKAASNGRGSCSKKKGNEDFVNSFGEYKELQTKKYSLWEEHIRISDFEILTKDTSNMNERARKDHEQVCKIIRAKYGIE